MSTTLRVITIVCITWTSTALADQVGDAELLFNEAKSLVARGRYEEACPKFAGSQRLDPGVGTLLYLADCYQHAGDLERAKATFRQAETAALAAGQVERARVARESADALEQKAAQATPIVEPSKSVVEAPIPGRSEATEKPPVQPATQVNWGTQRTLALVVGGVGVVGIVVGSVLGLSAKSTYDDSAQYCKGNTCTAPGITARNDAFSKATGATVAFVLGTAAIGGGAVLWFTAPNQHVQVAPSVGMGYAGLRGTW